MHWANALTRPCGAAASYRKPGLSWWPLLEPSGEDAWTPHRGTWAQGAETSQQFPAHYSMEPSGAPRPGTDTSSGSLPGAWMVGTGLPRPGPQRTPEITGCPCLWMCWRANHTEGFVGRQSRSWLGGNKGARDGTLHSPHSRAEAWSLG